MGVVVSALADETSAVAHILGPIQKPSISHGIIPSALNAKIVYPTFKDLWPPYQIFALAVVGVLHGQKWDAFNVIFENTYPYQSAYTAMIYLLRTFDMCQTRKVEVSLENIFTGEQNLTAIVESILEDPQASRLIVVLGTYHLHFLLSIINRDIGGDGKLIWVGHGDWMTLAARKLAPLGSLSLMFDIHEDPHLRTYLLGLNASNPNPWFLGAMQDEFDCSDPSCIKEILGQVINSTKHLSGVIDSVNVFAHSLKAFLAKKCPGAAGTNATSCYLLYEHEFKKFINYVAFQGISTIIDFRRSSFNVKNMMIYQTHSRGASTIGHFKFEDQEKLEVKRINFTVYTIPKERLDPDTYCRIGCKVGEHRHSLSRCCWMCRRCESHEVVSSDGESCVSCPTLYWPYSADDNSTLLCRRIKPSYFRWETTTPAVLLGFSLTGIFFDLVLMCQYWRKRAHFIIKASSVEISMVQLIVIALGYLAIILALGRPTTIKCSLFVFLFMASFNVLYFTMLIKAIRVYRIFLNTRGRRKMTYTSQPVQIGIILSFCAAEVTRFLWINQFYSVESRSSQPDVLVEYVEIACYIPLEHMVPFSLFVLILLFWCSLFAFKTQNLPNHFKESRFVSMCVLTTLIMWAVLMPSY
ncbi:unnamed protein product, partial [Lymnaea stagnalis]